MTTNHIRTLIVAAGLAAVPALAAASDEQTAVDRCARALVAELAAKSTTPLKLRESHYSESGFIFASNFEFMLVARRARDNTPVARALCRTDGHDQVIELQEQPLGAAAF
jgi:hypothetical protein